MQVDCEQDWAGTVMDQIVHSTVVEIAQRVDGGDLLVEYRDLVVRLTAEPSLMEVGDLATLCAVAVARVQILERELKGGTRHG